MSAAARELQGYDPNAVLDAIERERCQRSLHDYIRNAWGILHPPTKPFQDNWHIGAVSEHLEAVTRFEIQNLLVLIPPGHLKSLAVSVFWPSWMWGPYGRPSAQFIYTSYAARLSNRDSRKCRNVLASDWYNHHWGDRFRIKKDEETFYDNSEHGFRLATSVDGLSTGERGDFIVADDPHKVTEAESDKERTRVLTWWDEAMQNRVNDIDRCGFVVVMQRVHGNDLANHIMEQGDFTVLCLPYKYEPKRCCYTSIRPKDYPEDEPEPEDGQYCWDPRTEEDERLFPEFGSDEAVKKLQARMGSYAVAAQYQMRPAPRGGGMIKLDWFGRYNTPPGENKVLRIVQSWDTATKEGQSNAYSVCGTWAETTNGYYLLHVLRNRYETPQLKRACVSHAQKWKPAALLIEDASSGTGLIQHLRQETTLPVISVKADKDKETRMDIETPAIEAGNVFLPEAAEWLNDFEDEVSTFPASRYADQVDQMSQFLKWVRLHPPADFELY